MSIGEGLFEGCSNLSVVNIPEGLSTLPLYTFSGCSNLSVLTFPAGFTTMAERSLEFCTGLKELYFAGNAPTLEPDALVGVSDIRVFHLPESPGNWTVFNDVASPRSWNPRIERVYTNRDDGLDQFAFTVYGPEGMLFTVERCDDLAQRNWTKMMSLRTGESESEAIEVTDSDWACQRMRFYRVTMPR